jgi:outer membrane protein OmpA-like peptidoglycan-associated protein
MQIRLKIAKINRLAIEGMHNRPFLFRLIGTMLLLWMLSGTMNAQTELSGFSKYQLLMFAENASQLHDFISEANYLEAYLKLEPGDLKLRYQLGTAYFKNRNYNQAAAQFKQCMEASGSIKDQATFHYALCLKSLGNYTKALTFFDVCIKKAKNRKLVIQAKNASAGCKLAIDSVLNYRDVLIEHLGPQVNSRHLDISPVFLSDESLLFVSINSDSTITYTTDGSKQIPPKVFKVAHKTSNGWELSHQEFLSHSLGTADVSGGAFSADQQRFYFTVSEKDWKNKTINTIYMTEKTGNSWSQPLLLPPEVNLKAYTALHVSAGETYNPNLEALYFTSDRPGGFGGMDIWYTVYNKAKKTFIPPRNCGSKINSAADEVSPFYQAEIKTLFYSSNANTGYGGFDVYRTVGSLNDWTRASLLEYPLNTNADEIYYSLNPDLLTGYLVSNKPGTYTYAHEYCCYDIYAFTYKENQLPEIKGKVLVSLDAKLTRYLNRGIKLRKADSLAMVSGYYQETVAKLYLLNDEESEPMLIEEKVLADTGTYSFKVNKQFDYRIDIEHNNDNIGTINVSSATISNDLVLQSDAIEIAIVPSKPIEISNITYGFNEQELSEVAKQSLNSTLIPLLNDLPDIYIEVHSHTDSVGSEDYNLKLSQERAHRVIDFLVAKGIDSDRLIAKGFGETQFVAPNSLPDGSDNPEGREQNRRTEFVIVQKTKVKAKSNRW